MTATEVREQAAGAANGAEPAWEVALLFPPQGEWSESDYLALDTNRLVELVDGRLEVLPMPTPAHQLIVLFLYRSLYAFVEAASLGTVLVSPMPIRLGHRHFREPDVLFMRSEDLPEQPASHWGPPALVMEVISPDGRKRDLVEKRADYARAGIPEYWVIDPENEQILVLALDGDAYRVHGEFGRGAEAASATLEGFSVPVTGMLDAAR